MAKENSKTTPPARPRPSDQLLEIDLVGKFEPRPDLWDWVCEHILATNGVLHNPDHQHLLDARIGFLYTTAGCSRKGRMVLGMAEQPKFLCNHWHKARQELQMTEWFGLLPDFVITLDAYYAHDCSDIEFAALVEHELYHCAQARDDFGEPKFNRNTGEPTFTIAPHDVEEFVGVVRRYGIGENDKPMQDMVRAIADGPEISGVNIARACGTCMLKSA